MTTSPAPPPGAPPGDLPDAETLAALTAIVREHSRWAIWPPLMPFGQWTAVRMAGSRAPGPGLPLMRASAATATELSASMRRADAALDHGH